MSTNYSEEEVAEILKTYNPEDDEETRDAAILELTEKLERSRASIVSKLSSLKLYVKKGRTTKSGDPIISKEDLVEMIAKQMQLTSEQLPGLEKANKPTLKKIYESLQKYS